MSGVGLTIGAEGSYVGDGHVGGSRYGFYTAAGTVSLTGVATFIRQANFTAAGTLTFSGLVPRQVTKATLGSLSFSGRVGRQYTKRYTGAIAFSGAASANWTGTTVGYGATGEITFSGTAEAFKSRIETGGVIQQGSKVGELTVGHSKVGDPSVEPGLTFSGVVSVNKQSTKFTNGGLLFSGDSAVTKARYFSSVSPSALIFTGAAGLSVLGSTASAWAVERGSARGTLIDGSTVWELDDPNSVGSIAGSSNVWKNSSASGGTVVGGGGAWGG